MPCQKDSRLVLSIYCNARGFAFVLFEGPFSPFDWGVHTLRGQRKKARSLIRIEAIIQRYVPDIIVLQDMSAGGTRRSSRIIALNLAIATLAAEHRIPVYTYSRTDVQNSFNGMDYANKHRMAELIAEQIPAFERHVPPPRKPWMSEDARMGLFDAAALGLVFFQRAGREAQKI